MWHLHPSTLYPAAVVGSWVSMFHVFDRDYRLPEVLRWMLLCRLPLDAIRLLQGRLCGQSRQLQHQRRVQWPMASPAQQVTAVYRQLRLQPSASSDLRRFHCWLQQNQMIAMTDQLPANQ